MKRNAELRRARSETRREVGADPGEERVWAARLEPVSGRSLGRSGRPAVGEWEKIWRIQQDPQKGRVVTVEAPAATTARATCSR